MPSTWRDATRGTIWRLRGVFRIDPTLTQPEKRALITQANIMVDKMLKDGAGATDYWNTFANTLRTLVAAHAIASPDSISLFDDDLPGEDL